MKRRLQTALTSLWLILSVALGLRLGFTWEQQREIPQRVLSSVPFLYEPGNIAYSLAAGKGFSSPFRVDTGPTAWVSPVYPLLVAGVFRLFGTYSFHSFLVTVLLNILFSTLACVPIFFAGKQIGGLGVAAGSAWLWAVFPNAIIIPFEWIWDTCLSALLAGTILWMTLVVAESQRRRDWCGYGLLWGIALMTNASLASLLPFLLGWMAYRARRKEYPWLARPALTVGVLVLCCVPWTIRNYIVFHSFVPLRSVLGLQLWLGNNDQYRNQFPGWLHPIDNVAERKKYIQMGEFPYMQEKEHEAIQWMLAHPRKVLAFSARRFLGVWTGSLTPVYDFLKTHSTLIRTLFLCNLLAGIGTLFGMVLLFRKRSEYAFPVAVFPVVFPFAFYLTQALLRYRHPIDPIVLLLVAVAFQGLLHWAAPRDRQRAAG